MSSPSARQRIMARLKASGSEQTEVPDVPLPAEISLSQTEKLERLTSQMTAMRSEIHRVNTHEWVEKLQEVAREKGWTRMVYGPEGPLGADLKTAWPAKAEGVAELVAYSDPVENFKAELFKIDAGITSTLGGVADTGAIVLWPTKAEPRLLSLVPAVHVAVLDADQIANSLTEMMAVRNWAAGMPTNALLISGPSKTADIEFTLVFGVHGPKELILLIRT